MAASLALLVAIFMASFGVILKRFIEDTVTVQIMQAASDAARSAAQADMPAWTPNFATEDQGLSRAEITAELEDELGRPVAGELVEFRLTGPGRLTRRDVRSDALGIARSWLSSEEAGTARVLVRSSSQPSLREELELHFEAAALVVENATPKDGGCCDAIRVNITKRS